jgi:RimJ/RimL family protein N-acetyltransferase
MDYILETPRLTLRRFSLTDGEFIVRLVNSPGWLEYIGDRNIRSNEAAAEYLQTGPLKSYADHGFGLSLVELKESKEPIGMCGILKRDSLDFPDIGFAFIPEFMGKGYAYEIAQATMQHAKNDLNLQTVLAVTVPNNKSSIKLLEKIGMRFIEMVKFPNQEAELMLFNNAD